MDLIESKKVRHMHTKTTAHAFLLANTATTVMVIIFDRLPLANGALSLAV